MRELTDQLVIISSDNCQLLRDRNVVVGAELSRDATMGMVDGKSPPRLGQGTNPFAEVAIGVPPVFHRLLAIAGLDGEREAVGSFRLKRITKSMQSLV